MTGDNSYEPLGPFAALDAEMRRKDSEKRERETGEIEDEKKRRVEFANKIAILLNELLQDKVFVGYLNRRGYMLVAEHSEYLGSFSDGYGTMDRCYESAGIIFWGKTSCWHVEGLFFKANSNEISLESLGSIKNWEQLIAPIKHVQSAGDLAAVMFDIYHSGKWK